MALKLIGRKIYEVEQKFGEPIEDILKRLDKDKKLSYQKQAEMLGCGIKAQHILAWRQAIGMKGRADKKSDIPKSQLMQRYNLVERK